MSRHEWLMSSSRVFVGLTLLSSVALMTGCRPAEPTVNPGASVDGQHDHDGHDHDGHDHDGHDHAGHDHDGAIDVDGLMPLSTTPAPESLQQGIKQLASMRDTIAKGFADKDIDSIHDELHSVGNVLEHLEEMIDSSEISDGVKQQAKEATAALFEAFGDVDAKLHGEDGKDYADVSDKINSSIETLNNLELPKSP